MNIHKISKILILFLFLVIIGITQSNVLYAQTPDNQKPEHSEHPPIPPLAPPAPAQEDEPVQAEDCESERCTGVIPDSEPSLQTLAAIEKHTRGSNSQLAIPQNILLADIDADGLSDFLQYTSNKIFVSKTDFQKTGILHLYTDRPIKRVLTGDFHGKGTDQVCVITTVDALQCYGISPNRKQLWWWFTQGTFVRDDEDTIVGDFDGNGRDEILVYPHAGGPFRMYSLKGDFFFEATPSFNQGNLKDINVSGLQIRAGDFDGNGRDDLLVVDKWGQILHYGSVYDGKYHTFWWAFTTVGGFVGNDDQVTVARIDDNKVDDIVLRNRKTGATRFFRMEWNNGTPPPINNVSMGQIKPEGNSLLFWGFMHGNLIEHGANYRDDAMVYDLGSNMFVRSDARWDGKNLTYWWAYTQFAPNNHTGWVPFTEKRWLIIKCRFADITTQPKNNQFYQDLNRLHTNYWRDVSYGSWDLSSSVVDNNWYQMAVTNDQWRKLSDRWSRAGQCINAYGRPTSSFVNVISIFNGEGDAGNAGGRVLITPNSSNLTFLAHETGHTFGWWVHSFDDTDRKNADWSQPGEYFDHWDIMSAMAVHAFNHPQGGIAGPELNAPYKTKKSFIPAHRILRLTPDNIKQGRRINIAALNHPEADGPLMVRIGSNDKEYYTIEYRMKSGWDQGIPNATILVHRVKDGVSYLITSGGTERLKGSVSTFSLSGQIFTVHVHNFASAGFTADVTIDAKVNSSNIEKVYLPFIIK